MSNTVISVENLSKTYRLGQIGTGTLTNDLKILLARMRGVPNPLLKIGEKDYGNRDGETLWALKDITFTVEQGEVLGIIGRNGAGKSTLLKILSRVTAPTKGRVKVKGRIASLLEVGTGFHPELTGRENIYLNGAILGMTKSEVRQKFDEIVDFAEVEKFIDTPVKRYSSGMYVRLAFAVAAHLESEILIVDEVLAVGDSEFQKKCLGKMENVAGEGRTVLFVSHNMASIQNLCKVTIVMNNGILDFKAITQEAIPYYLGNYKIVKENAFKDRKKGKYNSTAYFTNIEYSVNNIKTSIAMSGQPLEIKISYKSEIAERRLEIAVGVYNSLGEKLLQLGTKYARNGFDELPQIGKVACIIPKLALPEGTYSLNLALYLDNKLVDHIESISGLEVHTGDYFGTGIIPGPKENVFLMDHYWDLVRSTDFHLENCR